MNSECVESCPSSLASSGVGLFKRRCAEPFTCRSGRLVGQSVNYGCKCATDGNTAIAPCQVCEHRAGEQGTHCTRCNDGMFLYQNRCDRTDCDGLDGVVEYSPGTYGRECRVPFTCTDRVDEDGNACKCSRVVGRNNCAICDHRVGGSLCLRCTNSKFLENFACVDECSSGSPTGSGTDGRECV